MILQPAQLIGVVVHSDYPTPGSTVSDLTNTPSIIT